MDGAAVDAVLRAAGHRVGRRRDGPAGLTGREVEVLRLVARGLSNKQIGARLVISPKTAGNHVEHIYTKIAATNRAAAACSPCSTACSPTRTTDAQRACTRHDSRPANAAAATMTTTTGAMTSTSKRARSPVNAAGR